jgi:signal transduction histidine kinase
MVSIISSKDLQLTGDRIQVGREKILAIWEGWARERVPAASIQSSLALRDHLPTFLDHVALTLRATDSLELSNSPEIQSIVKKHSEERAHILRGYTLDQVITEYSLLREACLNYLNKETTMVSDSMTVLHHLFDEAIRLAACSFAELKEKETLLEKEIRELFVATLSHDLKNPLAAAKANAQMIVRYPDKTDKHITFAGRIVESLNRADKMISDLLDANLIQKGKPLLLEFKKSNLRALVESCTEEQSLIHGAEFTLDLDPEAWGFWAIDELRRVLTNLISNGLKYGLPHSPVSITLKQTQSTTTLSVHNMGSFIPLEERENIFRAYRRLGGTNHEGQEGWGIGLTLVRGIVEAHHGMVTVASNETGTTFTVSLPNDSRTN